MLMGLNAPLRGVNVKSLPPSLLFLLCRLNRSALSSCGEPDQPVFDQRRICFFLYGSANNAMILVLDISDFPETHHTTYMTTFSNPNPVTALALCLQIPSLVGYC